MFIIPFLSLVLILYGLPKTHKNGNPIRPIFSAIGMPAYKISKFFVPILNKLGALLWPDIA